MSYKGSKCEEMARYREEKQRHREEKRREKNRHREEKRELKRRHREEKRKHREEFISKVLSLSKSEESTPNNVVVGYSTNSNVRYNNEMPPERIEHDVATIRTIFPDCDPVFIRNYLANETGDERVRKVAEKLLSTDYPKVATVTPSTPPTAPPLLSRNSFESPLDDEAPPSYEESMGNQSLQPPPLPNRHQRSSSWNGTSTPSSQTIQSSQSKHCPYSQISRSASNASSEVAEAIGTAVKSLLTSFKPSTVERACHKYSYIWSRPVPSSVTIRPLSQPFKILPKDKYSIQKGFNQSNYPSKELRYRDISEEDWYFFMNGLNSVIGVNSVKGSPNNFGDGLSVSLKWVSWMNVAMDEPLMEQNLKVLNEYIDKWNNTFFNPRRMMVQLIDNRAQSNNSFKKHPFEQYLIIKSI